MSTLYCPKCGLTDIVPVQDWMCRCRSCRHEFDENDGRKKPKMQVVEVSKFDPDVQERQKQEALAAIRQMMDDFRAKHPVEAAWQDLSCSIMCREDKDSLISTLVVAVRQQERQRFKEIVAAYAIPGHTVGMAIVENIIKKLEESEQP